MTTPKHPAGELASAVFHALFAGIGVAHVLTGMQTESRALRYGHIAGGLGMIWFHGIGAYRHWLDRHDG